MKNKSDEIKYLSEYENAIIVFDDLLGSSVSRFVDQYFIRGRHIDLDIYYFSQSYFDLPQRTIRNNIHKIFPFNQTIKDFEHMYQEVGDYGISFDEFKELCKKSWEED